MHHMRKVNKNIIKSLIAVIMVCSLAVTCMYTPVNATESAGDVNENQKMAEGKADSWRYEEGIIDPNTLDENAQLGTQMVQAQPQNTSGEVKDKSWDGITDKGYLKGIDVSKWQGDINWPLVKAAVNRGELDFVIIRCGFGANKVSYDDVKWERNADACEANDIPYGVYLYSYADSVAEARDEAEHALRLLEGYRPDYPVYYDLEDDEVRAAGATTIRAMASEFCSIIHNNGYRAGVYANRDWWTKHIGVPNGSKYSGGKYDKWYARWNETCDDSACSIWQCSSNGSISGISGRVDINLQMVPASYMRNTVMAGAYIDPPDDTTDVEDYQTCLISGGADYKQGPGVGYDVLGHIDAKSRVTVTETYGEYAKISCDGAADGKWVLLSKLADPDKIYGWEIIDGQKYLVTYGGEILKNRWYESGDSKYYLGEDGAPYTGKREIDGWTYMFTDSGINVAYTAKTKTKVSLRKEPKSASATRGSLAAGKSIQVTATKGNWSKVSNGYWILTKYTKNVKKYPQLVPYEAKVTKSTVIRKGPGSKYKKKGTYRSGRVVTVKDKKNGWGQLSNGYWILLKYTEKKL